MGRHPRQCNRLQRVYHILYSNSSGKQPRTCINTSKPVPKSASKRFLCSSEVAEVAEVGSSPSSPCSSPRRREWDGHLSISAGHLPEERLELFVPTLPTTFRTSTRLDLRKGASGAGSKRRPDRWGFSSQALQGRRCVRETEKLK